jgi:hypothetical protein
MLASHPNLPVVDILGDAGSVKGWILGYPITPNEELASGYLRVDSHLFEDAGSAISEFVHGLSGRFVVVFLDYDLKRFYLDSGGSLATVYAVDRPAVASTISLMEETPHDWDSDLQRLLGMPERDSWYPSGLTPRKSVRRLLPNHYLDLETWKPVRHWPTESHFTVREDFSAAVADVVKLIKKNIHAVAKRYPLQLSLTAGRDSRMLLACSAAVLNRIKFQTGVWVPSGIDCSIGRRLSRRFNLNHVTLGVELASPEELEDWQFKTGRCVSGEIWRIHPTSRKMDLHRAFLPGCAGEVGRAYYWREGDESLSGLTPEEILRRTKLPAAGKVLEATGEWLSEIAHLPVTAILDLTYIEQRLGCWAGPLQYGQDGLHALRLFPLNDRRIFDHILRMPTEPRRNQMLAWEICRQEWPELLDLPFNQLTGIERLIMEARFKAYDMISERARGLFNQVFAWRFRAC